MALEQRAQRFCACHRLWCDQGRQRRERQLRLSDRQPVLLDEPRSEPCRGRREPLRISPGEHKQDSERVAKLHRLGQLVRGGEHDRRLSDRQRTLKPRYR